MSGNGVPPPASPAPRITPSGVAGAKPETTVCWSICGGCPPVVIEEPPRFYASQAGALAIGVAAAVLLQAIT